MDDWWCLEEINHTAQQCLLLWRDAGHFTASLPQAEGDISNVQDYLHLMDTVKLGLYVHDLVRTLGYYVLSVNHGQRQSAPNTSDKTYFV